MGVRWPSDRLQTTNKEIVTYLRLFVCLFGFNVAFNIICHITTQSGCDRELNDQFYSPSPTPKIRLTSGEQLVPLLKTLVCRGPGLNPAPSDLGADTLPTELPRPVTLGCV